MGGTAQWCTRSVSDALISTISSHSGSGGRAPTMRAAWGIRAPRYRTPPSSRAAADQVASGEQAGHGQHLIGPVTHVVIGDDDPLVTCGDHPGDHSGNLAVPARPRRRAQHPGRSAPHRSVSPGHRRRRPVHHRKVRHRGQAVEIVAKLLDLVRAVPRFAPSQRDDVFDTGVDLERRCHARGCRPPAAPAHPQDGAADGATLAWKSMGLSVPPLDFSAEQAVNPTCRSISARSTT